MTQLPKLPCRECKALYYHDVGCSCNHAGDRSPVLDSERQVDVPAESVAYDPAVDYNRDPRCDCIHPENEHDPATGKCLSVNPTFGPCLCRGKLPESVESAVPAAPRQIWLDQGLWFRREEFHDGKPSEFAIEYVRADLAPLPTERPSAGWLPLLSRFISDDYVRCPNCPDVGYTPRQVGEDDWEQEQCEFCYTDSRSLFKLKDAIKAATCGII